VASEEMNALRVGLLERRIVRLIYGPIEEEEEG
jgi:hypothetical protein